LIQIELDELNDLNDYSRINEPTAPEIGGGWSSMGNFERCKVKIIKDNKGVTKASAASISKEDDFIEIEILKVKQKLERILQQQEPVRGYNPPTSSAIFDVEKPCLAIPDKKHKTPLQLRIEQKLKTETHLWNAAMRKQSKQRSAQRNKQSKKYPKLRKNGFPVYQKSYPNCPQFAEPVEDKVYIYVLVDPKDKTVRYVGQTTNIAERSKYHMKYEQGNPALWRWKTDIEFKFYMFVVCQVSASDKNKALRQWVNYFSSIGYIYNVKKGS
jgi:predicted GIY-YIG superfamily endonuclease